MIIHLREKTVMYEISNAHALLGLLAWSVEGIKTVAYSSLSNPAHTPVIFYHPFFT